METQTGLKLTRLVGDKPASLHKTIILSEVIKMYASYLISDWSMKKCRKARNKNLLQVLEDYEEHEFIIIHKDGKCIFQGYKKDFEI